MDFLPEDAPAPRLCHLIKWPDFDGYGFNLHAERSNPGQFIGKIDEDSPAQMAGLREGDRIVEVNGVNISNENHRQVVERIKSDPEQTRLLVIDAEADNWYKEQDFVVKSSQLNVIYSKTPIPRPEADSPRAKFHTQAKSNRNSNNNGRNESLASNQNNNIISGKSSNSNNTSSLDTTSADDFTNDEDSIEATLSANGQLQLQQQQQQVKRISPAPMSPDSGRGDEEPTVLTVSAEINMQSPIRQQLAGKLSEEEKEEEERLKEGEQRARREEEEDDDDDEEASSSSRVEPDSLSQQAAFSTVQQQANNLEKQSSKAGQKDKEEEAAAAEEDGQGSASEELGGCKVRNGSAVDSGQSSSPDTSSSRSLDSLEQPKADEVKQPQAVVSDADSRDRMEALKLNEDNKALTTIKNHQQQQQQPVVDKSPESNNDDDDEGKQSMRASTPTESQVVSGEPQADKQQALRSALVHNDNDTVGNDGQAPLNNNNNDDDEAHGDVQMLKMQQQQQPQKTSHAQNNNNLSGLNLNMTASEMRELIARRKKFDPKKAQMNIRQKYEIIQQM